MSGGSRQAHRDIAWNQEYEDAALERIVARHKRIADCAPHACRVEIRRTVGADGRVWKTEWRH